MEIIMAKEKHSGDKITEQTLHEILLDIKYRLNHLEDITADDRSILIKLVKQSNQIVKFLSSVEIEDVTDEFQNITAPSLSNLEKDTSDKMKKLKELVEEFMDKQQDLKEFEEELKKNKDKLTPGTIGES